MSSDLIPSTSEVFAKRICLHQVQIIQMATATEARTSGRGNFETRFEEESSLKKSVFDDLGSGSRHQPQNFLEIISMIGQLKKQCFIFSSSESQKVQNTEGKTIPRLVRLHFSMIPLLIRHQVNTLIFKGIAKLHRKFGIAPPSFTKVFS